jgi:RNA 3'-terminal phosphate cyclase (ATP)
MDWTASRGEDRGSGKRWVTHASHAHSHVGAGAGSAATAAQGPHATQGFGRRPWTAERFLRSFGINREGGLRLVSTEPQRLVTLDGSRGEGGGQILRTALTLSLLTGRPFRMVKIRANRDKPGLRPQHLTAVKAAAELGGADVRGASVGSRDLTFRPAPVPYEPRDLAIEIGTAGSTALVLQTLHLPLALRATSPVRLTISGGTFNTKAPSFPFLDTTWRGHLAAVGAPVSLSMPRAGFYPRGGGQLDAWIEPAALQPLCRVERGPLVRVRGIVGLSGLRPEIGERMRNRVESRLAEYGIAVETVGWDGPSPGVALALVAEREGEVPATFVGLGERGKAAEAVADEAILELLAFEEAPGAGALDPYSADQVLIPLALAAGRSEYTVTEVTEHLRTNARTIAAFLDREIRIDEADDEAPGRVRVNG